MVQFSLTVATSAGGYHLINIDSEDPIEHVKAVLEVEVGIPMAEQHLTFEGKDCLNHKSIREMGIKNNDMLSVTRRAPPPRPAPAPAAAAAQQQRAPGLFGVPSGQAPAIDPNFLQLMQQALAAGGGTGSMGADLGSPSGGYDMFDPEVQKRIESQIRQQQVAENFESAIDLVPESFGQVYMLYIDVEVNNKPVKAFVDSGAQSTIVSRKCAERLGLMHLLDARFSGMARGVGSARILGRVHLTQMKVGGTFFPVSLTVLDQDSMDFLLGLDMLRRHQACIDLKNNVLRMGDEVAPFLSEKDIPKSEDMSPLSPKPYSLSSPASSGSASSSSAASVPTAVPGGRVIGPSPAPAPALSHIAPGPNPSSAAAGAAALSRFLGGLGPAAGAAGGPPPALAQASAQTFPEDKIASLTALGYSRSQAVEALRRARGNVDMAASILFDM